MRLVQGQNSHRVSSAAFRHQDRSRPNSSVDAPKYIGRVLRGRRAWLPKLPRDKESHASPFSIATTNHSVAEVEVHVH